MTKHTRRLLRTLVAATVMAGSISDATHACSTFCINVGDRRLFGKNYDFEIGEGLVMSNPSGLQKRGAHAGGPQWTATFGSVTFNQFGRDHPMGGINTAGLVVELMWLNEARYPAADARSSLGVLEWIQYQLDTASSVDEVLKSDERVRIQGQVPLHYLVSDRGGNAATVEFLDGRLVAHKDGKLPIPVLTNSVYQESVAFTESRRGSVPRGSGSMERFARAADGVARLKSKTPADAVEAAFGVLQSVAQSNTRWTIVYDQSAGTVHFRTATHRPIRTIAVNDLDFSCSAGARMLDLDTRVAGDVTRQLQPYSSEAHLAMLRKNYAASSVTRRTPPDEILAIATRPEKSACASGP